MELTITDYIVTSPTVACFKRRRMHEFVLFCFLFHIYGAYMLRHAVTLTFNLMILNVCNVIGAI